MDQFISALRRIENLSNVEINAALVDFRDSILWGMTVSFGGIILYAKNVVQTAEFYETYFELERLESSNTDTKVVELTSADKTLRLTILQAAKSVKQTQA
jgi:hypothetical protein